MRAALVNMLLDGSVCKEMRVSEANYGSGM